MKFSEKLRWLARDANLSARDVAVRAGVKSHSTVNRWIAGAAQPRLSDLEKLAEVFGCSVAYLADQSIDEPQAAGGAMSDGDQRLMENGHALGVEQAAKLLELVGGFGQTDEVMTLMAVARRLGMETAMYRLVAAGKCGEGRD